MEKLKNKIGNPESISQKEEIELEKDVKLFQELFQELKDNKKLTKPTNRNFIELINFIDEQGKIHNFIFDEIILNKEKGDRFMSEIKKFGFEEKYFTKIILLNMIQLFNSNTEALKTGICSILALDDKKITLGCLIKKILTKKDFASKSIKKLNNKIDLELRNGFAHNLFWNVGPKIFYCKDIELKNPKELKLEELIIKFKNTNILFQSFLLVLSGRSGKKYF